MPDVTGEFVKQLAALNGIDLPDERVELVRREYETLMRSVAVLAALPMPRESEPALGQSLAPPSLSEADDRLRRRP
jgi:hypothetical protein